MVILEIPIYSMPEKKFNKKWEKHILDMVSQTSEDNKENFEEYYRNSNVAQRQWKYNQIIGYLTISYKEHSIWFNEYLTNDKIFRIKSNTKHYMVNYRLSGYHFYVKDDMSNDVIRNEILNWVASFEKEHLDKRYYLDKDNFIMILEHLDIRGVIEI